ncbi:ABC transporter substrate-binding protein [Chloroflexota bacterium]
MKKLLILVIAMVLLISVAGCQAASKARTIPVGLTADLTGPTSALSGIAYAARDYYTYYNEKYGGINGNLIEYELIDTGYDLSKEIAAYKELMTSLNPVSMHLWSTGAAKALRSEVNEVGKIPVIYESNVGEIVDPVNLPFNFISGPTYEDAIMIVLDWVKELGGKTVVFLTGPTEFHISPNKRVLEEFKYPEKIGVEVLDWIQYQAKPTDVTVEMLRAKKLNPDFYWIWDTPEGSIPCLRAANALGISPDKFIVSHWSRHPLVIEQVGAKGVEGVKSFKLMMSVDELIAAGLPVGKEIEEFSSNHDLYTRNWEYIKGWVESKAMVEAIKRAIDKNGNTVPGDIYQFRQIVRDEWEKITNWDIGFGVGPVDFSDHKGWTSMIPVIGHNGAWEVYGPPMEIRK